MKFNVGKGQRIVLLICASLLCMILAAVVAAVVGNGTAARVRIMAVVQDMIMFILPAVATAIIVTRRPAELLCLKLPGAGITLASIAALLCSIPAMNAVIEWNASLPLPEYFVTAEEQTQRTIGLLLGEGSVSGLVMGILIVGILAPIAEELYFRGCLQRLLSTSGMNIHIAIWVTAIIFSAVHLQMAGFVPRMLLGAFFGYIMHWSGSVWTAIAAHSINNILAAATQWSSLRGTETGLDSVGTNSALTAAVSVAAVALWMVFIYKIRVRTCRDL